MSDASAPPEWIRAWIEQQRALFERAGSEPHGSPDVQELRERWQALATAYFEGMMQFAQGSIAAPSKIGEELVQAWHRSAFGGDAGDGAAANPWSELLQRLPALGLLREHADAWRELSAAQAECQRLEQDLRAVLHRVQTDALAMLQRRVQERAKTSEPVATYRDLYDLWVDCGEQVYAEVAHSEAYSRLQAELGNAAMRLRARQQTLLEHLLQQFDLPTRSELNSLHRTVRALRERLDALQLSQPTRRTAAARPKARARAARRKRP